MAKPLKTSDIAQRAENSRLQPWLWGIAVGYMLIFLTVYGLVSLRHPPLSPDSWSYWDLSQTFWHDFYHLHTVRQFQFPPPYAVSFPPLYPLFLSWVDALSGGGIYSGIFFNLFLVLLTGWGIHRFSITLLGPDARWLSPLAMIALLLDPAYLQEVMAARSLPLALILILILLWVFCTGDLTRRRSYVLLGLLAGAVCMTRFDFGVAALTLGGILLWQAPPGQKRHVLFYGLGLVLGLFPWMLYSWTHFGTLWGSDNGRTVLLALPSHAADYFPPGTVLPTLWEAPGAWLHRVAASAQRLLFHGWLSLTRQGMLLALLPGLALMGVLYRSTFYTPLPLPLWRFIAVAPLFLIGLIPQLLSGYADFRYLILPVFGLTFLGLALGVWGLSQQATKATTFLLITATLSGLIALDQRMPYRPFFQRTLPALQAGKPLLNPTLMDPPQLKEAVAALQTLPQPTVLIDNALGYAWPHQFGALSQINTVMMPLNLTPCHLPHLLRQYQITALWSASPLWLEVLREDPAIQLHPLHVPELYTLEIQPNSETPSSCPP
jgi:hypothetical protein